MHSKFSSMYRVYTKVRWVFCLFPLKRSPYRLHSHFECPVSPNVRRYRTKHIYMPMYAVLMLTVGQGLSWFFLSLLQCRRVNLNKFMLMSFDFYYSYLIRNPTNFCTIHPICMSFVFYSFVIFLCYLLRSLFSFA